MALLWILLGLLALFLAVIMIRAARFRPQESPAESPAPIEVDAQGAAERLAQMVRLRTVSSRNPALVEEQQFVLFRERVLQWYPLVAKVCSYEQIGERGMLFCWKGQSHDAPSVLMSHYDVVPAPAEGWTHPPFDGVLENGILWGRGTLDTKGTLCGILEAAQSLMAQGFVPKQDVYFSFGGDEEIMGPSTPAIVEELHQRGVRPALVLDEGGAIVEKAFPGVKEKTAVVGVCEKGQMNLELLCGGNAGHTSAPPPVTAADRICRAVARLGRHPSRAKLTPAAAQMFDTLGRYSSFGLRVVFANLWCFWPLLRGICTKAGGELNALLRTTCTVTMMQGSDAFNVLPKNVVMHADVRILSGETMDGATQYLKAALKDDSIEIRRVTGCEPSPVSPADGEAWERVRRAILSTWPGVVVSPYMMVARSDSSNYCRISDHVLRFSAMELSKEERGKIHGVDECVPVEKVGKAVEFFLRVLRQC